MSPLAASLLATFGVSLLSLAGLIFFFRSGLSDRLELRLVGFAAGVLLATSFLDLLPEALEFGVDTQAVFAASLLAMAVFYYVERFIHGTHQHHADESHLHAHASSRYLILVGDGIHNFVDGVAIASAFLVSPELGVAATLAVAAHELPHEIADYGVLIHSGLSRARALMYNFLSALTAVLGAAAVFVARDFVEANLGLFLAAAAGMFIYIAAANLIPELHHQRVKGRFIYGLPFVLGILTIWAVTVIVPHGHAEEAGHGGVEHEQEHDHGHADEPAGHRD
ncbi:MAG: ZIP family metal transporter [bacterium]|nr:ZIP family metal transporter [bacterium]